MQNYFQKTTILMLFLLILASSIVAQDNFKELPRKEQLLNGLKVLIWSKPNTKKVSVSLRIHSGSAFDPQNREGTVSLLSEILFPEASLKKYFEEDLEGKLEVTSNYDYIQIDASAKSDEFLQVLEILAPAVSNPPITKKTLDAIRAKHLEKLEELERDAKYIADIAVAERLYGDFPYGRPHLGTKETIEKIDFADLIFARQRLLNADNATLIISGNVKSSYAYKAARRLLGSWQKSQKVVPANFRLPEEPDDSALIVNLDDNNVFEVRYALESVSRKDENYYATEVLTEILNERFKKVSAQKGLNNTSVVNESKFLRGYLVFSKELDINNLPDTLVKEDESLVDFAFLKKMFRETFSKVEFENAKSKVETNLSRKDILELWFDVDTYKMKSLSGDIKSRKSVTLNDVQNLASKLVKNKIVNVEVRSIGPVVEITKEPVLPQDADPKDPKK